MVEKSHKLIEFVKDHHLGLCVTANISGNMAVICMYDNFATVNSQVLQVTVSNLPNSGEPTVSTVYRSKCSSP